MLARQVVSRFILSIYFNFPKTVVPIRQPLRNGNNQKMLQTLATEYSEISDIVDKVTCLGKPLCDIIAAYAYTREISENNQNQDIKKLRLDVNIFKSKDEFLNTCLEYVRLRDGAIRKYDKNSFSNRSGKEVKEFFATNSNNSNREAWKKYTSFKATTSLLLHS